MPRLLLPLSLMCLLSVQVLFEVNGDCGSIRQVLGNAIKEVPDPEIPTRPNLVLRSQRTEDSLMQHRNPVCDPENTRHFIDHDDDDHMKDLFQKHNEFIQLCCNNG